MFYFFANIYIMKIKSKFFLKKKLLFRKIEHHFPLFERQAI